MSKRAQSKDVADDSNKFQIRPSFENKFKPGAVKDAINHVLTETLTGKNYETEFVGEWTKEIADGIKLKIKDMGYDRYKVNNNNNKLPQKKIRNK